MQPEIELLLGTTNSQISSNNRYLLININKLLADFPQFGCLLIRHQLVRLFDSAIRVISTSFNMWGQSAMQRSLSSFERGLVKQAVHKEYYNFGNAREVSVELCSHCNERVINVIVELYDRVKLPAPGCSDTAVMFLP